MSLAFQSPPLRTRTSRPLTEDDAVDIWVARWLRVRRKDLLERYGCDPRRLYEIWEGKRFPGAREKALAVVSEKFPSVLDRIDLGPHRRIPSRGSHPGQLNLFNDETSCAHIVVSH